jgi:hypothetical protein
MRGFVSPHMAELFQMFESEIVDNTKVDLKDVAIIKVVCDTFFLREIRPATLASRSRKEE